MDGDCFHELLEMVEPHIHKDNTIMRKALPPVDRLSLTLRLFFLLEAFNFTTSDCHSQDSNTGLPHRKRVLYHLS